MMRAGALLAGIAFAAACGPAPNPSSDLRGGTDHFWFRVSFEPMPARAREPVLYKVVVRDRETQQPIVGGEGRIFATSHDRTNVWNPLTSGPEVGTYYGTLRYVTAGEWAVAIQFRKDSTQSLERMDWTQEVRAEREGAP